MSEYFYECKTCGEIRLDLPFGSAKNTEICPMCGEEITRIYTPVLDIWKTTGSYNKTR